MNELLNGCTEKETLEIYNKFYDSPFCHCWAMIKDKGTGAESVAIGFSHYKDDFTVYFDSITGVGELFIHLSFDGEDLMEAYGIITVDKLYALLSELPHVNDFLEDQTKEVLD